MANELEQLVLSKAQKWLDGDYDEATKKQVRYLMDHDRKELTESFYKDLEFGTGGLRGIMGVGTNRMNVYTVGMATQGLANYLKKNFAGERIRVAIGHDSRNNSRMFAERVARNGTKRSFHNTAAGTENNAGTAVFAKHILVKLTVNQINKINTVHFNQTAQLSGCQYSIDILQTICQIFTAAFFTFFRNTRHD